MALYVDYLPIATTSSLVMRIMDKLDKRHKMNDLGRVAKLLGLDIKQSERNKYITAGQGKYVQEMLQKLNLPGLDPCTTSDKPNLTLTVADCRSETFIL